MTSGLPLISVIIPTLNRPDELRMCLEGLARQTATREMFEVIILDDGSDVDLALVVATFREKLSVVLERREHAGLPCARNAAIELARAPLLVLYDDDLRPEPELVDYCLHFHRAHPLEQDAALLFFEPGPEAAGSGLVQWAYQEFCTFPSPGVHDWSLFWGGSLTCKASLFGHCRFDPAYLSVEDAEFAARLNRHVNVRVHFERRVLGTLTRRITISQIYGREYMRGYYHFLLSGQHPDEFPFRYPPYEKPDCYVIHDQHGLAAMLTCADALEQQRTTAASDLLASLCRRLDLHAKAAGWIAAREGKPAVVEYPEVAVLGVGH